jgi:hypothetical protein
MGGFNQNPFTGGPFGGGAAGAPDEGANYNPGPGPANYPQTTISAPIGPPPQQLTTEGASPTISGTIDGTNNLFTWGDAFSRIQLFRNGIAQTIGTDISNGPTAALFLNGVVPQPGDVLTLYGWA